MFQQIYSLGEGHVRGALRASLRGKFTADEVRRLFRRGWERSEPLEFERYMGSQPKDLVGIGCVAPYLLAGRIVRHVQSQSFTGWQATPVRVFSKSGEEILDYHLLTVTGRCGPVDRERANHPWHDPPRYSTNPYRWWDRPYFNPATWDGSDFFLPADRDGCFVVERVARSLRAVKASNVRLTLHMEVVVPGDAG